MKKSIGLTANISEFRPNLPQTKHLNYFMGTNPVYMAGGGDVKAGIPNYPDVNVTRGFLPAALGFDNGGEADGFLSKLKRLFEILDGDLVKFLSFLKDKLGYSDDEAQKIANQISGQDAQPPLGAVDVTPQPVAPKDTVTPKDTVDVQPPSGAVDVTGKPTRVPDAQPPYGAVDVSPDPTSPKMPDNISVQSLPGPVGSGIIPPDTQFKPDTGISTITPDAQPPAGAVDVTGKPTNPLDLNGDGVVDLKDLGIAAKNGLWDIWKEIQKWLGLDKETTPEKKPEGKPDRVEVPGQGGPVDTVPSPVEPRESKTKEDDTITDEDQETLKKGFEIMGKSNQEQIEIANTRGITALDPSTPDPDKKKKDVPAWALPLMSAGFAMMASKSPYFMQALGEGGQKGLETFTAQETGKEEKLDKESERKLRESQSKYYETRTQKPDIKIMTDDQGRGVYYRWDNATQDYVSLNRIAVPSNADIAKELETAHSAQMWATYDVEKQQKLIKERRNQYLGIVQSNLSTVEKKGGGWSMADILGLLNKGDKWLEEQANKKDGGIVSLRR